MFERIKAYRNLKKFDGFIAGEKKIAELTGDEDLLREANEAMAMYYLHRNKFLKSHTLAKAFNAEIIRRGL